MLFRSNRLNSNLQQIGEVKHVEKMIKGKRRLIKEYKPILPSISSYWARHTWATFAAEIDIPEAVIDMALVHKSPFPMSDIYIRRNLSKVNSAITKVIDYVNDSSN